MQDAANYIIIAAHTTLNLPNRDSMPPATHNTRLNPTEPAPSKTPLGDMKIPDPATQVFLHHTAFISPRGIGLRQDRLKFSIDIGYTCMTFWFCVNSGELFEIGHMEEQH